MSTAVNLYNQVYRVAGVDGPLGDLGTFGSGLGVISALKSGNPISVASSGATFYNSIVGSGSVNAIPIPVINGLNLINAIQSGNPLSIASSAVAFIPGYGPLLSIGISVIGSLFGNHSPPPPPDGSVHYTWDETGAITIQTDQNVSGGGDTAHGTAGSVLGLMQSLVASNNHDNDALAPQWQIDTAQAQTGRVQSVNNFTKPPPSWIKPCADAGRLRGLHRACSRKLGLHSPRRRWVTSAYDFLDTPTHGADCNQSRGWSFALNMKFLRIALA